MKQSYHEDGMTTLCQLPSGITMKSQSETIAELNAGCEGPGQFDKFDRGVRASLSVSKEAVEGRSEPETAPRKKTDQKERLT
jgi:hypothetical protein